jgi:tRNA (guanine-N7-)-methyltransferase
MVEQSPQAADRRTVRSFVRRGGRVTRAQARALENLWPRYGARGSELADLDALFGRGAPRYLEIGFGMGDALAAMCKAHPGRDYLGVDVHEAGIGRLLGLAGESEIDNLRVLREDAVPLLRDQLRPAALDAILVFFPDPWPKKRHHKRRLVQPSVVDLFARCLRPGGSLQLATDWTPYAEQMMRVVEGHGAFRNRWGQGCYAPGPGERPVTRFQRRGERLGHEIHDLAFERLASLTEA